MDCRPPREPHRQELLIPELYFLLQKFLSISPLQETSKVLSRELIEKKILPARIDWKGKKHERTFEDLERLYPHIGPNHLLDICSRIGPILDKEIPPCIKGVQSLLGAGRQSLLRTADIDRLDQTMRHYAARRHGQPVCDPYDPKITHNISLLLGGREISGPVPRRLALPPTRYAQMQQQVQTLGHLSAVYCLLFDHTGRYIVTGADDLLIKLWSSRTGRLLASFRGASAEITDIDINLENTMLAAGSLDRLLRIWDLQTATPLAVLSGHTGNITSVNFCPSASADLRYVATTSSDGSIAFWTYSHDARNRPMFIAQPISYQEKIRPGQSQMICSSFSPGGVFLAAGSADQHVRVYFMRADEGPLRILEQCVHADRVDSISWAHRGLRFVSGSKDGTAYIWTFERAHWRFQKLDMETKLPGAPAEQEQQPQQQQQSLQQQQAAADAKKLFVTMVAWDYSDTFIVTAVSDHCLKVWLAATGQLQRVLTGHTDGIYVLEAHPIDPFVMLSTGHDGQLFVWDVLRGTRIVHFENTLDNGQGRGAVFDAKWSPDGAMFAASDSHGHIIIYAFGTDSPLYKMLPKEMFFHTDYRPLVRDPADHSVLDEQTQVPPHLMPPPFLVDIDGNPYPPMLQRLVPGRELCTSEQLVPNIVIGNSGRQEVIQGLGEQAPRSDIDRMIAALAQRQYGPGEREQDRAAGGAAAVGNAPRRSGEAANVEGVRQSTGEWQRDLNYVWSKRLLVHQLTRAQLETARRAVQTMAAYELADYQREIKKRPLMINTATAAAVSQEKNRNRRRRNGNVNTRRTRRANPSSLAAAREPTARRVEPPRRHDDDDDDEELDDDAEESNNTPSNTSDDSDASAKEEDLNLSDSSSDTEESSGYSDWVADQGVNLEPPKRSKRKSAHKIMLVHRARVHAQPDDDDTDDVVGTPAASTSNNRPRAKKIPISKIKNGDIPEPYKALEWLSETVPRKAPYCPQMGDEVVYFVQGHRMYVDAVRTKKIYNINNRDLPWTKTQLRDMECVKIVGIKYIIKPPRLCCLKLALLDEADRLTDDVFTIKYHDIPDVLDFIVLKQTYETAIARTWGIGDRFRCMIDDGWWLGKIEARSDFSDEHPDSLFMCYEINWDNGEKERMSPWDLEPICEDRVPDTVGEAVPVLNEEIQAILYQPTVDEWPRGDRDAACRRILAGFDTLMTLAIAEPFLAPVDLNLYPTYAFIVEYPVDLSTIKARFENRFYRRIAAAQFDVRYLAANAEQFNEPHSVIVKSARIITDLCLRIIKNCSGEIDVAAIYHQLTATYESSCSDDDDDDEVARPGPSTAASTSSSGRHLKARNLRSCNGTATTGDWRIDAKRMLDDFHRMPDSSPFRIPVDRLRHPEYFQMIDTPMDLSTVREDLFGGNYETPLEFAKDMRLIFTNSKNFNTNKRSKIYAMTVRLSAKFEEQFKKIVSNWKRSRSKGATMRKGGARKTPSKAKPESNSDNSEKENRYRRTRQKTTTTSSMSTSTRGKRTTAAPSTSKRPDLTTTTDDDDDDDDDEEEENGMISVGEDDEDIRNVSVSDCILVPVPPGPVEDDENDEDFKPDDEEGEDEEGDTTTMNETKSTIAHESSSGEDDEVLATWLPAKKKTRGDDTDDSDYQPLSKYARSTNHKRKKARYRETSSSPEEDNADNAAAHSGESESSTSDSDSGIKKNLRPRGKRRRVQKHTDEEDDDDDSDNLPLKRRVQNGDDDDDDEEDSAESSDALVSVSSRGRVRKMTMKARTLWRK